VHLIYSVKMMWNWMFYKNISWLLAKVSTSAYEAFDTGPLQHGKDIVVVNKDVKFPEAKHALLMAEAGYTQ
jgi:hypothetical protein